MIKRPSSETACPLIQGSGEPDEARFLSERENSRFFVRALLIRKSKWTACQKRRGFRFDRRLLVFHPRSLTGKRREDCCSSGRTPRTPALHEEATPPSSPGKETRTDPSWRGKHPLHSAGLLRAARSASTSERR